VILLYGTGGRDGSGVPFVAAWSSRTELAKAVSSDEDIFFSRSTDGGASWSGLQNLNTNASGDSGDDYDPFVITDGGGTWITAWCSYGILGEDYDIFFSRATDNGATWDSVAPLNSNAADDSYGDNLLAL